MDYGIAQFPTDYSIAPAALAVAAEDRGFESLWAPEHSHIPWSRKSPWPGGGELPKPYYHAMDPFLALASAATATSRIKLGTGICLVVQRDPIHTAKEVSTLDQLSGGRFLFGVGGGWNAEEMADHGTDFSTRFAVMEERIAAMKTIWTEAKAEFHGKHVEFDSMAQWPKPVQRPYPPVIVGGAFPWGARRAVAYGDGWMPIGGRNQDVLELLPRFRQMAAEAERDPDSIAVTLFGAVPDDALLDRAEAAQVARVIFMLPSVDEAESLKQLDALVESLGPRL
ncbi:MAG: LLM class F420-dependent oxidoreductase [Alphaproteobacteria bacterium]|nr:LLM class F420-dependent oxidoreductase [Alphaproteobacteria bacterium]MCY4229483.1 LLM class F420-dependent oxidoreductase [Alphaproteobacteria bacterium]MCY4320088.1 LLM class F420-dependent oxidoreductase [Alphaproteobacteria bacterium]